MSDDPVRDFAITVIAMRYGHRYATEAWQRATPLEQDAMREIAEPLLAITKRTMRELAECLA